MWNTRFLCREGYQHPAGHGNRQQLGLLNLIYGNVRVGLPGLQQFVNHLLTGLLVNYLASFENEDEAELLRVLLR